jgi:dCMP deaminase
MSINEDARLLALCARKGQESPDPRTKIGCLIIAPDGSIRCAACNDYPQGMQHRSNERTEAPLKYIWLEHAERNAIYQAARKGLSTEGCTMFADLTPCIECARAIIQAGIAQLVINQDRCAEYHGEKYSGEHPTALSMLAEARVLVRFARPEKEEIMRKVRMYVDGYNFYYAIKRKYYLDRQNLGLESLIGLGWCDFRRLGEHMIDRNTEEIEDIKYFTAEVQKDFPRHAGERKRQQVWLNAVSAITGLRKILGYFPVPHPSRTNDTDGLRINDPKELKPSRKEHHTDVNIAVEMLLDALDPNGYQKAILITGDTDLAPAVYAVQKGMVDRGLLRSGKTVDVWLPPDGRPNGWQAYFRQPEHCCALTIRSLTESMLAESLLPYAKHECPDAWRLPPAYLNEHVPDALRPDIVRPK